MGIGIDRAVGVVLGGDHRKLLRAIAITLEIGLGDATELAGKTAGDIGLFCAVASREQNVAYLGGGKRRHFFGAHDERNAAPPRLDEIHRAVQGGRSRRAGIFEAHGGRIGQSFITHCHQGALKILFRETIVHHTDKNAVDIANVDARMVYGRRDD